MGGTDLKQSPTNIAMHLSMGLLRDAAQMTYALVGGGSKAHKIKGGCEDLVTTRGIGPEML